MFTFGKSNKITKQISVSATIYITGKYISCTNRKVSTAEESECHNILLKVMKCFFFFF